LQAWKFKFVKVAVTRLHIDEFLQLAHKLPVLDVRSPGEYDHACLPKAYSLPLFSDEERAVVGTAYKQESREKAVKTGLDFFGPKMRKMVEEVETIYQAHHSQNKEGTSTQPLSKTVLVYCWRGGMRSAGVAWLLDLYGFKVYSLVGGYKSFRRYVLDSFKKSYSLKILGGYTGSGKTEILKELREKGNAVIDLESIAVHKGSAFGNIGMPGQPSQEMFENLLSLELRKSTTQQDIPALKSENSSLWLEDESQRIGLVNIPTEFWKTMRRSPVFFLDIPFEERLKHISEEYGTLDKERMIAAVQRISSRLGGLETKNTTNYLSEGNITEAFRILLKYYDKWYLKGLHNREGLNSLLHTISCSSVNPLNAEKLSEYFQYHENR